MVNTKKNHAPFGSHCPRFGRPTSHPNLDPSGLYVTARPLGCDPGRYHPQPLHLIFQVNRYRKGDKDPWRYKSELEQWSKNLGYRNQRVLTEREWQASKLGPAWTTVPPPPRRWEPACRNVMFGRTPRFRSSKTCYPGPGTYYTAEPYKAPYGPHSTRPTMEREEPCRFKDTVPKWSLAPNRYEIIDPDSIDIKCKRVVSKRGPYDLFTGKRDGSTIKNHFSTSRVSAATWPLAFPGSFEKLKKGHYGKMNRTGFGTPHRGRLTMTDIAMCVRRAEDPGPAHYDVTGPPEREFTQNRHGFNRSYDRPPGYVRQVVWPGVGRYTVPRRPPCGLPGNGHRHVFLSKIGRTVGAVIPEPMNSF